MDYHRAIVFVISSSNIGNIEGSQDLAMMGREKSISGGDNEKPRRNCGRAICYQTTSYSYNLPSIESESFKFSFLFQILDDAIPSVVELTSSEKVNPGIETLGSNRILDPDSPFHSNQTALVTSTMPIIDIGHSRHHRGSHIPSYPVIQSHPSQK